MKHSKDWTLSETKSIIQDMKDQAHYEYNWTITKAHIEEIISEMDYERNMYNSHYIAAIEAVDRTWQAYKEAASRAFWLDMIREEVEKKDITKKAEIKAI